MTNLVLALLETERPLPLREIGAAVAGYPPNHGALRQAFERDKASLREAGIPVETIRIDGEDQAGYKISREEYYLPDLGLDEDEAAALAFALTAVRLEGGAVADIAAKLGAPGVPSLSPIAVLPSLPFLAVLEEALRRRALARFTYRGRVREVAGYGLVFKEGSWYFVGSDVSLAGGAALRTFRADRIQDTPTLGPDAAYEVPENFSAKGEIRNSPFALPESVETTRVVVRVWPAARESLMRAVGGSATADERADASTVLSFLVADESALVGYLLGLGDDVEVLDPPDLRQRMIDELMTVAFKRARR